MRRKFRLSENDLNRIVKKIIVEDYNEFDNEGTMKVGSHTIKIIEPGLFDETVDYVDLDLEDVGLGERSGRYAKYIGDRFFRFDGVVEINGEKKYMEDITNQDFLEKHGFIILPNDSSKEDSLTSREKDYEREQRFPADVRLGLSEQRGPITDPNDYDEVTKEGIVSAYNQRTGTEAALLKILNLLDTEGIGPKLGDSVLTLLLDIVEGDEGDVERGKKIVSLFKNFRNDLLDALDGLRIYAKG